MAPDTAAPDGVDPYLAALISIRFFEASDDLTLTPEYLRKILLEIGFTHPVEAQPTDGVE